MNRLTTGAEYYRVKDFKRVLYNLEGQIETLDEANPREPRLKRSKNGADTPTTSTPKSNDSIFDPAKYPLTYRNLGKLDKAKKERYIREGRYQTYYETGYYRNDVDKYPILIYRKTLGTSALGLITEYSEGKEGKENATV